MMADCWADMKFIFVKEKRDCVTQGSVSRVCEILSGVEVHWNPSGFVSCASTYGQR